jgi:rubredoxin
MVTLECRKCGHIHDEDVSKHKGENSGRVYSQDKNQCPYCMGINTVVPRETIQDELRAEYAKRLAQTQAFTKKIN